MAERLAKKQGLNFHLSTKVTGLKKEAGKTYLTAEDKSGGSPEIEADKILVAVGRKPNTDGLGLQKIGLDTDEKGRIPVDKHFQTSVPASTRSATSSQAPCSRTRPRRKAWPVWKCIAGQAGHVNYDVIPNVIYTEPEIAGVGITEAQAKEQGIAIKTGKFNFAANGRAIASDGTDGFVKVIADKETDRLLGVQVVARAHPN